MHKKQREIGQKVMTTYVKTAPKLQLITRSLMLFKFFVTLLDV